MRLENDKTLVDPRNGKLLSDDKLLIQKLHDQGIDTVEDFMNVTNWFDDKFSWISVDRLNWCQKAQISRRCYAKWFAKQGKDAHFRNQAQQEYYNTWIAQHSTDTHFSNPYVINNIARVSYT